jgi:glyoxylase-like metal-dependent hydrolase (beta-lactamase superfamily II)
MNGLHYATHCERRPGVTRDLPLGAADLLWVANTATLIYGDRDAVLVDTFTTIDQNRRLIEWVSGFGKTLTHVYITHGHGDHFFGVKQVLEAFPGARAVGTEGTVAKAREQGAPAYLESFWGKLFPGQIPEPPVFPTVLDGDAIELEGHRLEVIEAGFSDTDATTALWVPDLRLVVAGDVAYNDIHQFMAETTRETRREWRAALERLKSLDPAYVVAGHKNPEREDDPAILDESIAYLRDFDDLDSRTSTALELYDAMLARYPRRANPGALWGSAKQAKP